ncbi:hypothetical protein J7E62_06280 [Variovorax paradoxus]|nr:hypothetical protein [Variovorax paradoxus]
MRQFIGRIRRKLLHKLNITLLNDVRVLRNTSQFDAGYYLATYPDVERASFDPIKHYLLYGVGQGLNPSAAFSTVYYLERYPDVGKASANPLVHYIRFGQIEGRQCGPAKLESVIVAEQPSAEGVQYEIELLRASVLFDTDYYLQTYKDVARSGCDPIEHYLLHGSREGRNPSEAFSTEGYLRRYADVASAGLNPLVHFLQHGARESRTAVSTLALLPSAAALVEARWPSLVPPRLFIEEHPKPRLTVVTDSVGASSLFGGVGTALLLGTLLSNRMGADLRLVTRTEPPDTGALASVLAPSGIKLNNLFEVGYAPLDQSRGISLSSRDVFLTTSWWTTRAMLRAVNRKRIAYLLQEDERMFYPYGDERLQCAETLGESDIPLAINTRLLYEHFISGADPLPNIARHGVFFEPAFPAQHGIAKNKDRRGRRRFFFYARPNNSRNLFWRGLEALQIALERGVLDPIEWEFHFVGKDLPEMILPHQVRPVRWEGLSWSQYHELVSTMDAALILMDTPHPSYPPLDLAAAGCAVLTNRHGGKTDLSSYSANILICPHSLEGLQDGLKRVVALARDEEARTNNRARDGISRDWGGALSATVEALAARFSF